MYRVKTEDIQYLDPLRQAEVCQICVGSYDLQFRFSPDGSVSVWSRCELVDHAGMVRDAWEDGMRSDRFRFFDLLGRRVVDIQVHPPESFELIFDDASRLRVIDNSEGYESFSVNGSYFV